MKFETELTEMTFFKREKRFFAHVQNAEGVETLAHLANTGSLKTCLSFPQKCWLSKARDPNRKLQWSVEAILGAQKDWIGVNTANANRLVEESLSWLFPSCSNWKREAKWTAETRFDFMGFSSDKPQQDGASKPAQKIFVEVKSVTYRSQEAGGGAEAQFPDAVTERGQKHLVELMNAIEQGHKASLLFVIQREQCKTFSPADHIDLEYGKLLREAFKAGVEIRAFPVAYSRSEFILLPESIPIKI